MGDISKTLYFLLLTPYSLQFTTYCLLLIIFYLLLTEGMKQIESFIRHWPRALFLMVIGALIGYAAWMYLPRHYTAITKLSVGIDYNRTGKLDDLEQDRLLGITEDMIHSDRVMKTVWEHTSEPDYPAFFAHTATTRTNQTWSLKVTGRDPKEIGTAAVVWLDLARNELRNALDHAILAESLQNEIEGLSRCIQDSVTAGMNTGCPGTPEDTFKTIESLSARLNEEQLQSGGISSAIRLGPMNPEQLQVLPASRSAAANTLLGALAGLLAAFVIVLFPGKVNQE